MIFKSFVGQEFNFYDENQLLTNLLSGDIGSGKTSFVIQYLYYLVNQKRDKKGIIDQSWKLPFKEVHINIDGFDFQKFNELAKNNGLNLTFHWLDFKHFEEFAKVERELYTKYNSDGGGEIAKNQIEYMPQEYKKYLFSLVICDEADHWITKINPDLATFLKWKRHLGMGVWFITQKYQNLDTSFYNSGAINRFLHIRNPLFNAFGYKFIEHWTASNRQKNENLANTYNFKIMPEIYDLYDSGSNIGITEKTSGNIKKYALLLPVGIVIGLSVIYFVMSSYFDTNEAVVVEDSTIKMIQIDKKLPSQRIKKDNSFDLDTIIIRCTTYGNNINCYYKNLIVSYDTNQFQKMIKDIRFNVDVMFTFKNELFLTVDALSYLVLFNTTLKKDNDDKGNSSSISVF